jgi:hypothetical protein
MIHCIIHKRSEISFRSLIIYKILDVECKMIYVSSGHRFMFLGREIDRVKTKYNSRAEASFAHRTLYSLSYKISNVLYHS